MGRVKHELLGAYELWTEDMPDLMGQALADAEREFLETQSEADNMPLWIQLELDLWENMQGYGGECDL
jgi:hypothetical protein